MFQLKKIILRRLAVFLCSAFLVASCGRYDIAIKNSDNISIERVEFNSHDHKFYFDAIEPGNQKKLSFKPWRDEDFKFSFVRKGSVETYIVGSFTDNQYDRMTIEVVNGGAFLIDSSGERFALSGLR